MDSWFDENIRLPAPLPRPDGCDKKTWKTVNLQFHPDTINGKWQIPASAKIFGSFIRYVTNWFTCTYPIWATLKLSMALGLAIESLRHAMFNGGPNRVQLLKERAIDVEDLSKKVIEQATSGNLMGQLIKFENGNWRATKWMKGPLQHEVHTLLDQLAGAAKSCKRAEDEVGASPGYYSG